MGFGDLKNSGGLTALNNFLADRSYIDGYTPSQADVVVFQALSAAPNAELVHALRWFNQINSYSKQFASLAGIKKPIDQYGPAGGAAPAPAENGADDDDDDFDLFGSEDEEEVEKLKQERVKEAEEKKKEGKKPSGKSTIVLDIKPWDDETDLAELEKCVRSVEMNGLLWGASKLVTIAYGIKKLQISCVVIDEEVSTEDLEEKITSFEDYIQSMDIVAFQKI